MSRTENETCAACHVRVRPQVYQEIRQAARIHACSQCKRILYNAATLRPQGPGAPGEGTAVEARNGGTV
jgi:C4-type zinc ribbon protein